MLFSDIIGQEHIKHHLIKTVENSRIPHAQLFIAPTGSGVLPLAIAYAQYILCQNKDGENDTGNAACNMKFEKLGHPDLHFAFPVTKSQKVKKHPTSNDFMEEWRKFVHETPYGSLFNWYQLLGIENKQGQIGVHEAEDIVKKLILKPFEGGFKVMIIWMAERMNAPASNKLLKLIEEPPEKTLFLLIAENEELIIKTILSRCQVLHFQPLTEQNIIDTLMSRHQVDENQAIKIAQQSNGNWNKALHLLKHDDNEEAFEKWFVTWVRAAFKAKGDATVVQDLIKWSEEIAKTGRETQKRFLKYCSHFFRQALLTNYNARSLVFYESQNNFDIEKFAPFVHGANIEDINKAIEDAMYHIQRNGNARIIFLDLSMNLTRYLHQKEEQ
ncbi:ATP-binding protein [Lutimonas zeaxanthinifaciens]|uniref:DNA polymerase III subunit n=1 Tax=Lutimonas zeaxanthinifaciens TaxID=3060215 RepID=UPI00265CA17A|nr:DNA polymerase III subunit delta' [Lutimonas sp. YSD2104]WKK65877.1 DNA polymerase III subunit delta' [Lutimonas sp. YSD2104]